MRTIILTLLAASAALAQPRAGVRLAQLTWLDAERVLTPATVVVIPLGAESKEHGPHLQLNNDFLMAEYLANRVLQAAPVVLAPTVNYIAPETVDMSKAVKDFHPGAGPLVRDSTLPGTYSRTGIWGDPTLATREKGRIVTEALVAGILRDIRALSAP
jgi:creatinine amidohydrolase/Fe(II)-dependent formamide hydrolase-like protein